MLGVGRKRPQRTQSCRWLADSTSRLFCLLSSRLTGQGRHAKLTNLRRNIAGIAHEKLPRIHKHSACSASSNPADQRGVLPVPLSRLDTAASAALTAGWQTFSVLHVVSLSPGSGGRLPVLAETLYRKILSTCLFSRNCLLLLQLLLALVLGVSGNNEGRQETVGGALCCSGAYNYLVA